MSNAQSDQATPQERLIDKADGAAFDLKCAFDALGDALNELSRNHDHDEARELFRELEDNYVGPVGDLWDQVSQLEPEVEDAE